MTDIHTALFALRDPAYQAFQSKLIPTIDPQTVIGVRMPALRKLAREIAGTPVAEGFLQELPHRYYEENNLHGLLISAIPDYDGAVAALETFLPYVDNWATCDLLSPKAFRKHPPELRKQIRRWVEDAHTYTVRFGLGMLMSFYLDEGFQMEDLDLAAGVRREEYYVKMMAAWYFATALAKQACAGRQAQAFADIGPIPGGDPAEYDAIVDAFLQLGADRFLLETFAEEQAPLRMARRIKAARPDALVIVSFAVSPDGFSQSGRSLLSLLRPLDQEPAVDLLGLNCVSGPFHLLQLVRSLPPLHKPLSVMPNAGSPKELSGRTYFPASPAYFASQLAQLAPYAKVLGGCCASCEAK